MLLLSLVGGGMMSLLSQIGDDAAEATLAVAYCCCRDHVGQQLYMAILLIA
jgi:hypothetical protein